jgi:hypothetical protein
MQQRLVDRHPRRRACLAGVVIAVLAMALIGLAAVWQPWAGDPSSRVSLARMGLGQPGAGPAAAASRRDTSTADALQLVVGGMPRSFTSGSEVPVAGEVLARIGVSAPGDQRYARTVEVFLYRQSDAAPIDDARIAATAHMIYMDHGTFHPEVIPAGGGHYVLPVPFVMPGEWQLDMDIAAAGDHGTVELTFNLLD